MNRVFNFLRRQPRSFVIGLGIVQLFLVGLVDYLTGPDLAFSIFYLLPVLLAVFSFGRTWGLIASVASAAAWFIVDMLTPRSALAASGAALRFWNSLVHLNFFLIITLTISALRTAQKKQEELVHFIVHDLRSPLSGMLLGLQTLGLPELGPLNPCQREILARATNSGSWMATLINSLLDLSRLEHGRLELAVAECGVEDLLDEALQQIALPAELHKVRLARRNQAQTERVRVDRALALRILLNLLSNAVKFTPQGKAVTLAAAAGEGEVVISVEDEGPGVPKEYLAAVFDKYFQVEARQAGALTGSGLGLSFCAMGVRAQGGRIWMESEPGRGTAVRFTVPRVPPAAPRSCDGS